MDNTDWTFDGTWPHEPRWHDTPEGRLHYVDVGRGRPVVLVHGNPSWGYLFRHFIPPLVAAGFRVVVPDHLGFGRSDKPAHGHAVADHARRLGTLLDALGLDEVTLIPHDWGGPIALDWATRRPQRVHSLVLLNTFVHPPERRVRLPLPLRLVRIPGVGELLVKGLHLVARAFLLGGGLRWPRRLSATSKRAYLAPHLGWSTRAGILALARQFPSGPDGAEFQAVVTRGLPALATRPILIAWATHDPVLGTQLAHWRRDFPNAAYLSVDAGHFLQEEAHAELVPAVVEFLGSHAAKCLVGPFGD